MQFTLQSSVFSLICQWPQILGDTDLSELLKCKKVNQRLIYFLRGASMVFSCLGNPFLWKVSLHSIQQRLEALATFYLKHVCLNYNKLFYSQTYECHVLSKLYILQKVFKNTLKLQKYEMHIENDNLSSFSHITDVKPSFLQFMQQKRHMS